MQRHLTCFGLLVVACASSAYADNYDGYFDSGFATGGREQIDVSPGSYDLGRVLRIQPDGKLLVGGTCTWTDNFANTQPIFCATRLNGDASLDACFGFGGSIVFDRFVAQGFPEYLPATTMALLNDGRVLFTGSTLTDGDIWIAILTADGRTLDTTIAGNTGFIHFKYGNTANFSTGSTVFQQSDGKILVAGNMDRNGNSGEYFDMAVQRFLPDLSVDTSFGIHGYQVVPSNFNFDITTAATSIAVQTNGSIVLAGYEQFSPSSRYIAVVRLLQNGQPDTAFGPSHDGRERFHPANFDSANSVRIDTQGRIVFAGYAGADTTRQTRQCFIHRLHGADGSPDLAGGYPQQFQVPVGTTNAPCEIVDLAVQSDGNVLAVGTLLDYYFAAVKLTPGGAFDSSFGFGGKSYGSFDVSASQTYVANGAMQIGNGGLMIAGASTASDTKFGITRLTLSKIFANGFD